ncbi:hypothetical protein TNCV_4355601 [Trichonephila clavipes]|nr:hypothetical protein TNCV_4355601 [Trichonephila clavipes]
MNVLDDLRPWKNAEDVAMVFESVQKDRLQTLAQIAEATHFLKTSFEGIHLSLCADLWTHVSSPVSLDQMEISSTYPPPLDIQRGPMHVKSVNAQMSSSCCDVKVRSGGASSGVVLVT